MKVFLILSILIISCKNYSFENQGENNKQLTPSIGMVIYSNDTETVWNALRLANYFKNQGDTVRIFLLGKGVELDNLVNANNDIKEQTDKFLDNGGIILGCGTCLKSREIDKPQVCRFS